MGVNCCQELSGDELTIENIIEDEIMETVLEKDLTYSDYLSLIETEEKVIADIDNDIEVVESELEDINISIDLEEAKRLNLIKEVYNEVVNKRKEKEARLEKLEIELDERRNYLNSLNNSLGVYSSEDDEIDREAEVRDDIDSLTSSMDTHIEKEQSSDALEERSCEATLIKGMTENFDEVDVVKKDGVYIITDSPYVIGTDGQVLF